MTTVTSLTADRMLAIEAASVVDGDVVGGNLILTKHDGSQINAGPVTGPTGPQGPQGALLPVISGVPVLDVGLANQIRAGRQLTAADFTNMGLSAPLGLWNLSDLTDVSGNGRNLLNKGAVPFGVGINGGANTAAQFSALATQVFYIVDTGANDPFRIKTGSYGCWFRTARSALSQQLMSKHIHSGAWPGTSYDMFINGGTNSLAVEINPNGSGNGFFFSSISNVCDDRWHFGVVTIDGAVVKIYVDCVLEASAVSGPVNVADYSGPFNIGGFGADSANTTNSPHGGRVDEAFITSDILSEDQVRNLYCVKIPHTLAVTPSRVSLNVHRRRKGATLEVADFPTQPLRLYNFSGGSLGDEGSNGAALTNNGAAVSMAGVDGSGGNAFNFNGAQSLSATDAGLPSGLNPRSYGCWFKSTASTGAPALISWGPGAGGNAQGLYLSGLSIIARSPNPNDDLIGSIVLDGIWHHVVVVEDNGAGDGVKRKMYVDGRLVGISTIMNSLALGGATRFRIGSWADGSTVPFIGQIDGVFVCDYALTAERIAQLYAKGSQTLASSPKNPGDHVEAMSTSSLLATFDTLESQHTIDLGVEP